VRYLHTAAHVTNVRLLTGSRSTLRRLTLNVTCGGQYYFWLTSVAQERLGIAWVATCFYFSDLFVFCTQNFWESFDTRTGDFLTWLPTFYDEVLNGAEAESRWCASVLPDQHPRLVLHLLATLFARIDKDVRARIAAALAHGIAASSPSPPCVSVFAHGTPLTGNVLCLSTASSPLTPCLSESYIVPSPSLLEVSQCSPPLLSSHFSVSLLPPSPPCVCVSVRVCPRTSACLSCISASLCLSICLRKLLPNLSLRDALCPSRGW
jgi:hypothetical protein